MRHGAAPARPQRVRTLPGEETAVTSVVGRPWEGVGLRPLCKLLYPRGPKTDLWDRVRGCAVFSVDELLRNWQMCSLYPQSDIVLSSRGPWLGVTVPPALPLPSHLDWVALSSKGAGRGTKHLTLSPALVSQPDRGSRWEKQMFYLSWNLEIFIYLFIFLH